MSIRFERADDREVTFEIERTAFGRDLEAEIARAVADDEGSFAFVAEADGDVIGHVQMSRAWIGDTPVLALGPIGVMPARQREGVGSTLVRAALAEATRRGERAVMLLGDPAFYDRFGFLPAASFGIADPSEEHFMVAPLDGEPL